jgi:hypothetical protein
MLATQHLDCIQTFFSLAQSIPELLDAQQLLRCGLNKQ